MKPGTRSHPRWIAVDFVEEKMRPLLVPHCLTSALIALSTSSARVFPATDTTISSAYACMRTKSVVLAERSSFMVAFQRIGPKIDPWGQPLVRVTDFGTPRNDV